MNSSSQIATKEIATEKQADHTSWAVVFFKVFLFLMGKDEFVVYTVMYPAFLNEQARNLI